MATRRPRLPSVVRLPFGFNIDVRRTTKAGMLKLMDAKPEEEPPVACWVHGDAGGTIWLLRYRSHKDQLDDLTHEMQHAITDWSGWAVAEEREGWPSRQEGETIG